MINLQRLFALILLASIAPSFGMEELPPKGKEANQKAPAAAQGTPNAPQAQAGGEFGGMLKGLFWEYDQREGISE